jgi:hypothetical protein
MSEVDDRGDNLEVLNTEAEPEVEVTKEPEVEAEVEVEVKADAETDDAARDEKGRFIPKDRFDEAVRKERSEKEEYARRLKEYEDKEAQRNVSVDLAEANKQVKELIKQHTSLLADGELDKASDLMEQILEIKEEITERKAAARAEQTKTAAKEEVRYDALVAKLESDFPQINPDAEEFDKGAVRRVQAYMSGLMQTERMSATQALKEAVETILGKPAVDSKKADDTGVRRKEAAVAKAMDAQKKQPASTKEVGIDSDKVGGALDASAVMKMSYDEFVKLPDTKLAEMRGDFV